MAEPLTHDKFECTGTGLTFSGHNRASPISIEYALGIRTLGRILPGGGEKIIQEKHRKSWWEAQVRLYGLKCSKWTINGMKEVLMKVVDGLEVPAELQDLEARLNREYQALEKENRLAKQSTGTGRKNATLGDHAPKINTTAANQSSPEHSDQNKAVHDDYHAKTVFARTRQLEKMNRLHRQLLESPSGPGDDIFGTWQFDCKEVCESYCSDDIWSDSEAIWGIHRPQAGELCLWVSMDHIVVEGVLCLEWKDPKNWKGSKLNFVWRGRETGESDIQCDDAWNNGHIIFTSPYECSGIMNCEFGDEPWEFTGKKISIKMPKKRANTLKREFRDFEFEYLDQPNVICI